MTKMTMRKHALSIEQLAAIVRYWQANHADAEGHALKVDGIVGPATIGSIDAALSVPTETPPKSKQVSPECTESQRSSDNPPVLVSFQGRSYVVTVEESKP